MCGIAGAIGTDGADVTAVLERLTGALRHRGPDGEGFHYVRGRAAGLGHRRLAIVDLVTGAQPMTNESETVWVTYNGEIYNQLELRQDLVALGHRFRTTSDTEVLVHGFEAWGPGLFGRLNGIFAFGLLDARTDPGQLWLVRDPVGAKPLYLGYRGGTWWFASELGAARTSGLVDTGLRPEAIPEFLVYRFIPSPGTPFRHAWKVPPGHSCVLSLSGPPAEPTFARYDTRFAPAVVPNTEGEWAEALRAELVRAVRRQLMSDVPLGTLLSGGVDSTIVTGVMRDALAEPPQAFAIGFADHDGPQELGPAREAARALSVPLTEVEVGAGPYVESWLNQVAALGEPIADTSSGLVAVLCREVHATRKVVLTGQGADEPLGGYPRHAAERWYPWARHLRRILPSVPARFAASDRVARLARVAAEPDPARRYTEILAVFSPAQAAELTGQRGAVDLCVAPMTRAIGDPDTDSVNRLLRADAHLSLADDLLTVADHTSMASSVELRVPFLDLQLLALIERMPSRYKVSRLGERKWLYRKAVRPLLAPALRRKLLGWRARTGRKLGFATPLERWASTWVGHADRFLLGKDGRLGSYVRPDLLTRYLEGGRRGAPQSRQLAVLFVLESWLRALES
ncbi:MAG TPA: asparagine synthase (glutamine-hydrolyzing) [Gemmatimonadales bacterium]|nr:asparagine synthase (glutamine-hydrolyzing) [Gemmatimonadales bacterium]